MSKYDYDYSKLSGLIREKLKTNTEYAKQLGVSKTFISKIFNNRSIFNQLLIDKTIEILDIPSNLIDAYFFTHKVHMLGTK